MQDAVQPGHLIRFATFEVDLESGELHRNGLKLRLSGQPFQVLAILLERPGSVVSRGELQKRLWPDTFVDFDHNLNAAINRIREVLGDSADSPRFVETVHKQGYRFIAPVVAPSESGRGLEEPFAPSKKPGNRSYHRLAIVSSLVLAGGLLAILWIWIIRPGVHSPKEEMAISSIAVLPLSNLSGDPSQEYFADGITESLIGRLSMIKGLRVISRTSAMQFKNTHNTAPEIAKALNVDALVEGSVIRDGNRVRVQAQLIRATTDEHFWSETYDRETQDALGLESDIAQAIARKVEVTVTSEERARLVAAQQVAPEVYENYLKGRQLADGNTKAELEDGIAYLQEAIRRDATFAPAYVGLADAYRGLGTVFIGKPAIEMRPKVVEAAKKALELNPDLADAHVLLAEAYQEDWRWSEAEAEFNKALRLNPSDAAAYREYSQWLLCHGRFEEALAWARRAQELDPLGDASANLGWTLMMTRRYDEAIRELRSVVAVRPDYAWGYFCLGFALTGKGQHEEAISVLEKAAALTNRSSGTLGVLAMAYARAGRREDAVRLVNELNNRRKTGYVSAAAFVFPAVGFGDREHAFAWLERAYQEKSNVMQFVKVYPFFDLMRDDPRYQDLVRRVGLAD